jgi:hypothetical protein
MSAHANIATIRRWVDAINRNDIDAELACWQPDGEFLVVPTGATYNGTAQLRRGGQTSASLVGSSSPKTWRSADTPGARAGGVLNRKERSQPTPVAMARCGNRHVGGGCCASSRSIP